MALDADELLGLAARGEARAFAPLLCRELALSRSQYHKLLIRLRDERALLQVRTLVKHLRRGTRPVFSLLKLPSCPATHHS